MAKVRIELREFVEVVLGQRDVTGLVGHFAEKVMRISDLARFGRSLQARFTELAGELEILEAEVAEAEVDVRLGAIGRRGQQRQRTFENRNALGELVVQHFGRAEVFEGEGESEL